MGTVRYIGSNPRSELVGGSSCPFADPLVPLTISKAGLRQRRAFLGLTTVQDVEPYFTVER